MTVILQTHSLMHFRELKLSHFETNVAEISSLDSIDNKPT